MHHFEHRNGRLYAEDIPVEDLVREYGTPLYVYSRATLARHYHAFDSAFQGLDHMTCYSVKANSNLSLLKMLGEMGAGMDIVSGGELHRAVLAGIAPEKIVYSGVGKTDEEIGHALDAGILMFNVESLGEVRRIDAVATSMGRVAPVAFRINPDVDPQTHPYVATGLKKSKFGLDMKTSLEAYRLANELPGVEPVGIDCHIGSQLTSVDPFMEALDKLLSFRDQLESMGMRITYLDLGGGLGITYDQESPPHPAEFGARLSAKLQGKSLKIILEPGRVIAGNAGILVFKVLYTKTTSERNFVVVDAGMNDLLRPSLYGSYHRIGEVNPGGRATLKVDVVGPICESGDFLAQERELPAVEPDELLAAYSAGAYGFVMSSQYNSRPRAAEVVVDGRTSVLARRRETYEDLTRLEIQAMG
jgi:diaminopimelate decarboxylase